MCGQIESHARTGQGGWSWHASPRPGDLALFTISGAANHVGIVEAVTSTQVVTIEGNTHQDVDPGRGNDGYGVFPAPPPTRDAPGLRPSPLRPLTQRKVDRA